VIIVNEDDALQSLRRAAREADTPAPVDRLSLVLNAVIPAVKKLRRRTGKTPRWRCLPAPLSAGFFGNHGSIRGVPFRSPRTPVR